VDQRGRRPDQFGAFVEILQPGSRSSLRHWHSAEDEMVYVLEGRVTLVEERGGDDPPSRRLRPSVPAMRSATT
jgi:oxalate decarboxylase/phosphoglucose isomerase-like protein (cupin superfamily)